MKVIDSVVATEQIRITVFQSAGLISQTKVLALMASKERDSEKRSALIVSTILVSAAALEALLLEAAHELNPELYKNRNFRMEGVPFKFKKLVGRKSDEIEAIWEARKAISHSEPHNKRSRFVGEQLNTDSVKQIVNILESISNEVWGKNMPNWFIEGAKMA